MNISVRVVRSLLVSWFCYIKGLLLNYIIYGIPLMLFLLYFALVGVRVGKSTRIGDFLAVLYFVFLLFGYVHAVTEGGRYRYDASLPAMLYLSLCILLYLAPVAYVQRRSNLKLDVVNYKLFMLLVLFLCVGGFSSLLFFSVKAYEAYQYGFGAFRLDLNQDKVDPLTSSLTTTVFVAFSLFFGVSQLLGLLIVGLRLFGNKSTILGYALILSSLSYVFNVLAFAGRDGVVFWFLSMFFNLILVRSLFSCDGVRSVVKFFIVILILVSLPFFVITYQRFGGDMFYSIFYYVSHQLATFNEFYVADLPIYYGDYAFGDIKKFIGLGTQVNRGDYFYLYLQKGVVPWTWGYFVGSLLQDFGRVGTVFFIFSMALIMFLVVAKKSQRSKLSYVMPLDVLLVFYLYCQVGFMGIFYFKHYAMNNYMLTLIILSFFIFIIRSVGSVKVYSAR